MAKKHYNYSSPPQFPLREELAWLGNVSVWSAPPDIRLADVKDGFLLGGGGRCSARLGMQPRLSKMERVLAPYLSSYNFAENNNFRMDVVTPSRDFYPPFTFTPTEHHIWRVRNSGIVITAERDDTYEVVTVNAVHPIRQVFLRYASLKNISNKIVTDIGLSFDAPPDVPFPAAGHRSVVLPLNDEEIMERVQEMKPAGRDYGPHYSDETQRHRYMVRGIIGGKVRGYQDLFAHWDKLKPGEAVHTLHYLAPGLRDDEDSAIESAQLVCHEIEATSVARLFQEVQNWWEERADERTRFTGSNKRFIELLENNAVLQTSVELPTGGFTVIDDYTGTWMRDHNGSHLFSLDLGLHNNVKRSMDRYYALDVSNRSLYSVYASDIEPVAPLPAEPDWESIEGFITGDVPNFRTLWYGWYFKHTGDLQLIAERFNYMKGAFMRQKLHDHEYLAEYCYDETYGIGPVGPMRVGFSADNSFIALSAARTLAYFANLLGRDDAPFLADYADSIHAAIEKTFWLKKEGYYAMRVKPDGTLDKTPLSIGLLRPLWTGVPADDDHAIKSAVYTLKHLYKKNGFLHLIPSHDQTVTMAIGYLLSAMKKIGHPEIDRVFNDVLKWADPSGTFGEYLQELKNGPWECYEHLAHRNRMWESGINADAIVFALTGFEPNAYERRVSFTPYLPAGWNTFASERFRVGDSRLSLLEDRSRGRHQITVRHDSGEPLNVEVVLTADAPQSVRVDMKATDVNWQANRFGIFRATLERPLNPNEHIVIQY